MVWAAHRGFSDMYPENTIDSYEGDTLAGAGFIEADIRLTKDLELVCMHDEYLANMTNAPAEAKVYDTTFDTLRTYQINNGNGLKQLVHKQIPTFAEYLHICKKYGVVAIIDLKDLGENQEVRYEISRKILQTINSEGLMGRCIIISRSANLLRDFRDGTGEEGASIPVAASTSSAWNKLRTYGLTNVFSSHKRTAFGTYEFQEYNPLNGRKNQTLDSYHNRV